MVPLFVCLVFIQSHRDKSRGYRLVAGDTCDPTTGVNKLPIKVDCDSMILILFFSILTSASLNPPVTGGGVVGVPKDLTGPPPPMLCPFAHFPFIVLNSHSRSLPVFILTRTADSATPTVAIVLILNVVVAILLGGVYFASGRVEVIRNVLTLYVSVYPRHSHLSAASYLKGGFLRINFRLLGMRILELLSKMMTT